MRTDQHTPRNMDPAAYTYIGSLDRGDSEDPGYEDPALRDAFNSMDQHHGHFESRMGCDHCGQHNVRYFDGFRHEPSGELVVVGWQCADSFSAPTRQQAAARKRVRKLREIRKMRRELAKWAAANDQNNEALEYLRAQLIPSGEQSDGMPFRVDQMDGSVKMYTIKDEFFASVLRAALTYGYLTERQRDAVLRSKQRRAEFAARREEERADEPDPAPVIEGRIEISGKVLSVKTKDNPQYGTSRLVMTVLDDRGFRVWGTVPADVEFINVFRNREGEDGRLDHQRVLERGDRVRFTARVEASKDDETFGFYKRPTKAELLDVAA